MQSKPVLLICRKILLYSHSKKKKKNGYQDEGALSNTSRILSWVPPISGSFGHLSTSSGRWARSTNSATSCCMLINLTTALKSLSALLYILWPYPCWTCLCRFCCFLTQPSHLPSTETQVTQPLLEGCCNKTSASDLKWVASSFPSPVQTACLQLSMFGIGFLDVVFPWYCRFPRNHLPLKNMTN